MKLSQLNEIGSWVASIGHPGSVVPPDGGKGGTRSLSFLLHPQDREKAGINQPSNRPGKIKRKDRTTPPASPATPRQPEEEGRG